MICEHQENCGFFNFLKTNGKLVNGTCGKNDPSQCVRFSAAEGEGIAKARKVFRVEDLLGHPIPMSHEEISIAYPIRQGGDSSGS